MQISPIKLYTYKPTFSASSIAPPVTPLKRDTFEKEKPSFEQNVNLYYKNLEKDMGLLNENDIHLMIERVSKKVPNASKEEILYTMDTLSQYSSYKSWGILKENLKKLEINSIDPNPSNLYITNETTGKPISLTSVFSYLFKKNCMDLYRSNGKHAMILDSNLISLMEKTKVEDIEDNILIYIENFENGYNFLNQSENFEDYTAEVTKKAKEYNNFKQGLHEILNGENLSKLRKLEIEPTLIKYPENEITTKEIADRLNPIIIAKNDFLNAINAISFFSRQKKTPPESSLEFLQKMNVFVTPKQFSQNLKTMHEQINECAKQNGFENLYYIIPDFRKSFGLVNYMFGKINNIPDEKFLYYNLRFPRESYSEKFDFLPDNSTLVVLDDCCISGSSLKDEQLHLRYFMNRNSDYFNTKSMNFIIAPMYATEYGKGNLESIKNPNHSSVILPLKMLPEVPKNLKSEIYFSPMNDMYHNETVTSLVLPYMGPDTNNPKFIEIYEKMLFCPEAQKEI